MCITMKRFAFFGGCIAMVLLTASHGHAVSSPPSVDDFAAILIRFADQTASMGYETSAADLREMAARLDKMDWGSKEAHDEMDTFLTGVSRHNRILGTIMSRYWRVTEMSIIASKAKQECTEITTGEFVDQSVRYANNWGAEEVAAALEALRDENIDSDEVHQKMSDIIEDAKAISAFLGMVLENLWRCTLETLHAEALPTNQCPAVVRDICHVAPEDCHVKGCALFCATGFHGGQCYANCTAACESFTPDCTEELPLTTTTTECVQITTTTETYDCGFITTTTTECSPTTTTECVTTTTTPFPSGQKCPKLIAHVCGHSPQTDCVLNECQKLCRLKHDAGTSCIEECVVGCDIVPVPLPEVTCPKVIESHCSSSTAGDCVANKCNAFCFLKPESCNTECANACSHLTPLPAPAVECPKVVESCVNKSASDCVGTRCKSYCMLKPESCIEQCTGACTHITPREIPQLDCPYWIESYCSKSYNNSCVSKKCEVHCLLEPESCKTECAEACSEVETLQMAVKCPMVVESFCSKRGGADCVTNKCGAYCQFQPQSCKTECADACEHVTPPPEPTMECPNSVSDHCIRLTSTDCVEKRCRMQCLLQPESCFEECTWACSSLEPLPPFPTCPEDIEYCSKSPVPNCVTGSCNAYCLDKPESCHEECISSCTHVTPLEIPPI